MQYVATLQVEHIYHFGTGDTPDAALDEFIEGGDFQEHCEQYDVADGEVIEVPAIKAYSFDEMDEEERSMAECEGWSWVTRNEIAKTRTVTYKTVTD